MSKRTELKVDISCEKCKKKILQAVSGLQGIHKIEVDSEKSTLVVTGDVDPIDVILRARKAGKYAEIITISALPKAEEKKKEEEKNEETKDCYRRPVVIVDDYCHTGCIIM